jgi:hypothetical protein
MKAENELGSVQTRLNMKMYGRHLTFLGKLKDTEENKEIGTD